MKEKKEILNRGRSYVDPSEKDPRGYPRYVHVKRDIDKNPSSRKIFLGILKMEGWFTYPEIRDEVLHIKRTDDPKWAELYFQFNFSYFTAYRAIITQVKRDGSVRFHINDQAWVKALKEDLLKEDSCDSCDI